MRQLMSARKTNWNWNKLNFETQNRNTNRFLSFEKSAFLTFITESEHTEQHLLVQLKQFKQSEVEFRFLGDKKGPTKGFLPWSLEYWISIFLVYLLNHQKCFYFLCITCEVYTFMCSTCEKEEIKIWSWIAAVNPFKICNVFASLSKITSKRTAKNRKA